MPPAVGSRPYVAVWHGNTPPLRGARGELSAHKSRALAIQACLRQRNAIRDLWGGSAPWFIYQVIDCRDGSVVGLVT